MTGPVDASGDFRFLLPSLPRTAGIVGDLPVDRLVGTGLDEADPATADVVVAASADAGVAAGTGAAQVVLFGRRGGWRLRRAGYTTTQWMALGSEGHRDGYVRPRDRRVASYATLVWRRPASRLRRLVLRLLVLAGVAAPKREVLTVASRPSGPPRWQGLVDHTGLVVGATGSFFLATPGVEAESRVAAFLFADGERRPSTVVKILRVPDVDGPFVDDERGLALVRDLGPEVTGHVPALLGRGQVRDHHACGIL